MVNSRLKEEVGREGLLTARHPLQSLPGRSDISKLDIIIELISHHS